MRCGVRFCGGCNPRYDRGSVLQQIKEAFPEIEFSHASEGEVYDFLLVIGGCPNCCASYEQFQIEASETQQENLQEKVLKIWDPDQYEDLCEQIQRIDRK